MTFPTNTGDPPLSLSQTFVQIRAVAGGIKQQAVALKARSLAGPVPAPDVMYFCTWLANHRATLAALAATEGLAAYVATYFPAVNLAAAYTTMVAQVDATIAWMVANFPKAASGELLLVKFAADGTTTTNTFSTAVLTTFRAQLDLLIAQID